MKYTDLKIGNFYVYEFSMTTKKGRVIFQYSGDLRGNNHHLRDDNTYAYDRCCTSLFNPNKSDILRHATYSEINLLAVYIYGNSYELNMYNIWN
jgi:hypothetical protein